MLTEYPKIETLYKRDDKTFAVTDELRLDEFAIPRYWYVTEKIHGTNIRVHWDGNGTVTFAGRKSLDPRDIHKDLLALLHARFNVEIMEAQFAATEVLLFGEGYGAGIQKGGGAYSLSKDLIIFDVLIAGYWLEPEDVKGIATKLGCLYVPELGWYTLDEIPALVKNPRSSVLAQQNTGTEAHQAEGIICRTTPGLVTRYGTRLMFKLKYEDFKPGKR